MGTSIIVPKHIEQNFAKRYRRKLPQTNSSQLYTQDREQLSQRSQIYKEHQQFGSFSEEQNEDKQNNSSKEKQVNSVQHLPISSIHANIHTSQYSKSKVIAKTHHQSSILGYLAEEGRQHFKEVSMKRRVSMNLKAVATEQPGPGQLAGIKVTASQNCPELSSHINNNRAQTLASSEESNSMVNKIKQNIKFVQSEIIPEGGKTEQKKKLKKLFEKEEPEREKKKVHLRLPACETLTIAF